MASYDLVIKKSAARELESLPSRVLKLVVRKIQSLADVPRPHGVEKLTGDDKYRLRQGAYRVVYEINDAARVVTVVKIAHRRDVYR